MKKINLFLVSLVVLLMLSIGFSSCGGNSSSRENNSSSVGKSDFDKLEIKEHGYYTDAGVRRKKFLVKNISNERVGDYRLKCKVYRRDETSAVHDFYINLFPGEAKIIEIWDSHADLSPIKSWEFFK